MYNKITAPGFLQVALTKVRLPQQWPKGPPGLTATTKIIYQILITNNKFNLNIIWLKASYNTNSLAKLKGIQINFRSINRWRLYNW